MHFDPQTSIQSRWAWKQCFRTRQKASSQTRSQKMWNIVNERGFDQSALLTGYRCGINHWRPRAPCYVQSTTYNIQQWITDGCATLSAIFPAIKCTEVEQRGRRTKQTINNLRYLPDINIIMKSLIKFVIAPFLNMLGIIHCDTIPLAYQTWRGSR